MSGVYVEVKRYQRGFTLIEALIAFVIVSLALIGTAMFQSQLIAESGNSKAKMVAIKLAEEELEEQRRLLLRSEYDALGFSSSAVTTENTEYLITSSVADVSAASAAATGFETHKQIDVTVSWTDPRGGAENVQLSSLQVWSDPANSLDNNDEAGTGGGNVGLISRPNASAVAIARVVETVTHDGTKAVGDYVNLGGDRYGIKTTDCSDGGACTEDEVTAVIKLVNTNSPIMEIRGGIYVYRGEGDPDFLDGAASDIDGINASPNVLTTEGGGCAVYEKFPNVDLDSDGINDIAYTCLFGEGWYGNITLILYDSSDDQTDDTVCLGPRSYRYYRINKASVAAAGYPASIIGQSGLVRFTLDNGEGPYVASDSSNPGLGYYYLNDQVDESSRQTNIGDALNKSGNVYNQHFVVSAIDSNLSVKERCVDGLKSGGNTDEPLFDSGDEPSVSNASLASGALIALVEDDYAYKGNTRSGSLIEIPNDVIVLGFVDAPYELTGDILLTAIADDFNGAGSTAAQSIAPYLSVGLDPLPALAQACALNTSGDGSSIGFVCYVNNGWTGNIEASLDFSSGPAWTYIVDSPASKAIATGVSASADVGDFSLSCPSAPCQ